MQQFDIQSTGQYARKSQAFSSAYYNGSPATWIGRLSCWSDLRCALYPARSSTVTLKPPHTMKTTVFFALPTSCGPNTRCARAGLYAGVMEVAHESSTRIFCSSVIDIEYSTDETRQICKNGRTGKLDCCVHCVFISHRDRDNASRMRKGDF